MILILKFDQSELKILKKPKYRFSTLTIDNCGCDNYHECTGNGCLFNPSLCPNLPTEWKGSKYSKVIYKAFDGYSVRVTVPNNVPGIDIRTNPYTGFIILSRRHCGAEFTSSIMNGNVKLIIMDTESVYEVFRNLEFW